MMQPNHWNIQGLVPSRRRCVRVALLWLVSALCVGCAVSGTTPPADATPRVGTVAPDFSYTLLDGTTRRLSDARGTPVIVNFWATWCAPCREEMPILETVATTYGERVLVLGVNRFDDVDAIKAYAAELGVTFPLVLDEEGEISARYRVYLLPLTVVIDQEGVVRRIVRGPVDQRTLDDELAATVSRTQP